MNDSILCRKTPCSCLNYKPFWDMSSLRLHDLEIRMLEVYPRVQKYWLLQNFNIIKMSVIIKILDTVGLTCLYWGNCWSALVNSIYHVCCDFQVPSREVDKDVSRFWTHWNRETKQVCHCFTVYTSEFNYRYKNRLKEYTDLVMMNWFCNNERRPATKIKWMI